ncbi:HTH Tnp Tc3 2 domain containing protein [Asbolus verrucosus]|uniref:HTH Tnp Tc3 2 domain containing protein n=1 Tax=Asbolus verrucosus TaxID=1661398 RepID=A0A482WAN6_ASBVE|nr:HTH Tnp Tc3 2 domain containing protein [Asbolus verrucosus]
MVRRFNETGSHFRSPGQGRKCCSNPRDERFLRQSALRNRKIISNMLKNELAAARNLVVSTRTVRRRLNEAGLSSRKPAKEPLLTREHNSLLIKNNDLATLQYVRDILNGSNQCFNYKSGCFRKILRT